MLQQFLNKNLIQINEDGNFDKLKKASDDLAKKIGKDKAKITSYTLAAIDPQISATDGGVVEVQEIIVKHWTTFVSNSKDTYLTIIRAVILEALETVAKDQNCASLIWNATRNVIRYYNLDREKELIVGFLQELGNNIEKEAIDTWLLPHQPKTEKLVVEIKELTGVTIDKSEIESHLKAAAIHSGLGEGGENPQYPSHNALTWPQFFSTRAASGITDVINKALKKQAKDISANQILIQEAANKMLNQVQSEIFQKNRFLQMRTHLLWWKEACYSSTLKKSYRGIENGLLEISLATDYGAFVPHIYPASADFFLLEFHKILTTDSKIKLAILLDSIKQHAGTLKEVFTEPIVDSARNTLLNFIKGLVWGKCDVSETKALTGLSEDIEITYSDFILWMFHDAQVFKITSIK